MTSGKMKDDVTEEDLKLLTAITSGKWSTTREHRITRGTPVVPPDIYYLKGLTSKDSSLKHNQLKGQTSDNLNNGTKILELNIHADIHNGFYRKDTIPENTVKLPFLPNYRSPCWRESFTNRNGSQIRCLPYFYIVGPPKCGTTDLYKRLKQHPLISSNLRKEFHWLTRKRFEEQNQNLSSYLTYFDRIVERTITKYERNTFHPMVFGDNSVSTLWDNRYLLSSFRNTSMTIPPYSIANIVHHLNPNAKILIILRDPIARLYSEYLHFRKPPKSVELFHQEVTTSINHYTQCSRLYCLRYCAYFLQVPIRIQIGFYHIYIEDYMRVFSLEQIKILKLEEHSQSVADSMAAVFTFLDIGRPSNEIMSRVSDEYQRNKSSNRKAYKYFGDMHPMTRQSLAELYKPYNERLVKLLGEKFRY